MQQRLCLAHALVHDPQVLLLDEPASGLDPRARVELRELLRELRSLGKTIVISSHILPELEELCTSVAIIDHGRSSPAAASRTSPSASASARVYRAHGRSATTRRVASAEQHFAAHARRRVGRPPPGRRARARAPRRRRRPRPCSGRCRQARHRLASFAPAASDLEELFLQITDARARRRPRRQARPMEAPGMTAVRREAGWAPVGVGCALLVGHQRRVASRSCAAGCAAGARSWC